MILWPEVLGNLAGWMRRLPEPDRPALEAVADRWFTQGPVGALPARSGLGFYGRDDTLLALDRAFDTQPIVLLHGEAGIGKTTTASEFGRWLGWKLRYPPWRQGFKEELA